MSEDHSGAMLEVRYAAKTLRDEFAMAALPAALADFFDVQHRDDIAYDHAGELAYKIADAMLKARERKE